MSDVVSPMPVSSGDVVIDRRFEWARESLAAGDAVGAADLLEQTLALAPGYAPAWFALAQAREALGDAAGAVAAFREAATSDPDDRLGAHLHLVRLGAEPAGAMPAAYVQTLYDAYAPRFEKSLVEGLSYRAPDLLLRAVERAAAGRPMHFARALDLGCGTGLAGAAFRPFCNEIVGVDLSPRMLTLARAKDIYARLVESDVLRFAADAAASGESYDLVLSADVFIYFHDLMPLQEIAPLIKPDGLFAFTVETHDGEGVVLRDTLRYAHGEAHVRAALQGAGLDVVRFERSSTRSEKGVPVPSLVVVARMDQRWSHVAARTR